MDYTLLESTINKTAPLIYMWEISDRDGRVTGRYIGKANRGDKRPTRHYSRNVNKLLRNEPYKNGKNYRRVHFALAEAVKAGDKITLSFLCNVSEEEDIFKVEGRYIRDFRCDADDGIGLNGPWKGPARVMVSLPRLEVGTTPIVQVKEPTLPDLEDFLEYVEEHYKGLFEVRAGVGRYSLWKDKARILRAAQSGPAGKVNIKLAQSSTKKNEIEYPWDGSDGQLDAWIRCELEVFAQRKK